MEGWQESLVGFVAIVGLNIFVGPRPIVLKEERIF